jgi:hypothetical protein
VRYLPQGLGWGLASSLCGLALLFVGIVLKR